MTINSISISFHFLSKTHTIKLTSGLNPSWPTGELQLKQFQPVQCDSSSFGCAAKFSKTALTTFDSA